MLTGSDWCRSRVVSPAERVKLEQLLPRKKGAMTVGDLVILGRHHSAAHLRNAALGLDVCLQAAFRNSMPAGICVNLLAQNCSVLNKVPFNMSQGNPASFQPVFCLIQLFLERQLLTKPL